MKKYLNIIILMSLAFITYQINAQDNVLTIYNCHPKGLGLVAFENYNLENQKYAPYYIFGTHQDTLWFTYSHKFDEKNKINIQSDIYYSTRPATDREKCASAGWSKPKRLITKDVFDRYNRGSFCIFNDIIITSSEIPIINKVNNEIQGTSYNYNLITINKNSYGDYLTDISPKMFSEINNDDYWYSQPCLTLDKKRLFFVSNQPLPDRPKSTDLNIWYSDWEIDRWSKPKPANEINTIYNEQSPHCGVDGKFYYSSDMKRDNLNTEDYDIYVADLINGLPDNPQNINRIYENNVCINDPRYLINTEYNEVFPFVMTDSSALFYSSNRMSIKNPKKRNTESVYSIFAAKMQPPCIRLTVNAFQELRDYDNSLISRTSNNMNNLVLTLHNKDTKDIQTFKHLDTLVLDPKTEYFITYELKTVACYECLNQPDSIRFITPNHDQVISKTVTNVCLKKLVPRPIYSQFFAAPFFIDGYWKPSTSKNLREYIDRVETDKIDSVLMHDVIVKNYGEISDDIDNLLENQIVREVEALIPTLKRCWDTLAINIEIHAYSDSCVTDPGHYCCDAPVAIDGYTIDTGFDFTKTFIEQKNGQRKRLEDNGLNGKIVLSELRAYYTYQALLKALKDNISDLDDLMKQDLISISYEGKGLFDSNCKNLSVLLDKYSIIPDTIHKCSNTLHNTAFIFINVIGRNDLQLFRLTECGTITDEYRQYMKNSKFEYINNTKETK